MAKKVLKESNYASSNVFNLYVDEKSNSITFQNHPAEDEGDIVYMIEEILKTGESTMRIALRCDSKEKANKVAKNLHRELLLSDI